MLLNGCRRTLTLYFDVGGHRDGLDVFDLLIPSALDPGQKLLDCPVIGGSCVSVPDRDRKKLEELFPVRGPISRDESWSLEVCGFDEA